MRANIRNIYQPHAYLEVQRFLYLLMVVEYVKTLKVIEAVASYMLQVAGEEGRTRADTTFIYSIEPPEYTAITADIDLYSKDDSNNESWVGYLVGDSTEGEGRAVLVRGAEFDITRRYEAEVVLNRGSDMEVRGKRVELVISEIRVLNDVDTAEADEIKFGDGSRAEKAYHIELQSKALTERCEDLRGAIRVVDRNMAALKPDTNVYYSAGHSLKFELSGGKCTVKINDTTTGLIKDRFIISNLSRIALQNRLLELQEKGITVDLTKIAVLYGGIGNEVEIEINGAKEPVPIEPVGVIVLGIDGLRQDVLYPPESEDVKDPDGNYYINQLELPGIGEILKGHQLSEANQQYIMLPEVTAVFPSITLASWASIFTGKMPKDTGILGNEFFARDLYETGRWWNIPGMWNHGLPKGMITLSDGAFPNNTLDYYLRNLMPAHNYYDTTVDRINNSPQNLLLSPEEATYPDDPSAQTIYEWLRSEESIQDRMSQLYRNTGACMDGGDCQSAVFFSHYARGTDWWGTQKRELYQQRVIEWLGDSVKVVGKFVPEKAAELLDEMPTKEALDFLETYFENKDRKFPALFTLYYGGPDHYAHEFGLKGSVGGYSGYSDYFKKYTDRRIREVMNKLRELDEFDNKIFIITADHGHTGMPEFGMITITFGDKQKIVIPDTSCELNVEGFEDENVQYDEKYNNNLHIWELGEVLKAVGEYGLGQYKVLAPKEIAELYKKKDKVTKQIVALPYGATDKVETADIIVGFNGPMAHVYVADINKLGEVAELFRLSFESHTTEAAKWWDMDELDYLDFKENMIGRLKESIDKILVRIGQETDSYYCVFGGLNDDRSIKCADTDPFASMDYVNAWERIEGMNNPDRSGDIVLIMKDKTTSNAIERYTTGTACKSWHGSLNPSDSYVPFIVAYPGGNKKEVEDILQRDTLCKADYSGCKGNWKVTDIVKEIIKEQYQ